MSKSGSGNYWLVEPKRAEPVKSKSKKKFKSADAARVARELEQSWEKLNAKWKPLQAPVRVKRVTYVPERDEPERDVGPHQESLGSWVTGATSSPEAPVYTGTKILGISTMHKSNLVPVFAEDHIVEIARMRR